MSEATYERILTLLEIHERRINRDELDDQLDGVRGEIAEKKREIKEAQVEEAWLDARIRQLRWEIKTGKVTLPRQATLPLDRVTLGDVMGDPVEDPRDVPIVCELCNKPVTAGDAVSHWERCGNQRLMPKRDERVEDPRDFERADTLMQRPQRWGEGPLLDAVELRRFITTVRPKEAWPTAAEVGAWHPDVRADVQRWCSVEHARKHPIAGVSLLRLEQMPNVLANLEHAEKPKRKPRAKKAKAE